MISQLSGRLDKETRDAYVLVHESDRLGTKMCKKWDTIHNIHNSERLATHFAYRNIFELFSRPSSS